MFRVLCVVGHPEVIAGVQVPICRAVSMGRCNTRSMYSYLRLGGYFSVPEPIQSKQKPCIGFD